MASTDIRIGSFQRPMGRTMVPATYVEASTKAAAQQQPFLLSLLRKRWYLLLFILPLMGAAGYGAAEYFGSTTAKISTTLLYTGIPMPSGQQLYRPLDISTSEMLIKSPANLNKVMAIYGLKIPPAILARFLQIDTDRSGVVEITLSWADETDGIKLLSIINEQFTKMVAEQRKNTIGSFTPDIQKQLTKSEAALKSLNTELISAKATKRGILPVGIVPDNSTNVTLLESALDQAEFATESIKTQIKGMTEARQNLFKTAKNQLLDMAEESLQHSLTKYAMTHPDRAKLLDVSKQLKELKTKTEENVAFTELFEQVIGMSKRWISAEDLQGFSKLLPYEAKFADIDKQLHALNVTLPIKEMEIKRLTERLEDSKTKFAEKLTAKQNALKDGTEKVNLQIDEIEKLETQIEEATATHLQLQTQMNNLNQLKDTMVKEFSVVTPPSSETTTISSNKKKLFVGGFFLVGLILIPPVLLVEWLARRETPIEEASRVFSLPVLGRNLTYDALTDQSQRPHEHDSLRLLALRIQQSLNGTDSAMVVFSSLDRSEPAATLVAEIGKCLAEREERVLVVDASGSTTTHGQLVQSLNQQSRVMLLTSDVAVPQNVALSPNVVSNHGLAEFLMDENLGLDDLVQKTADPQIDYLRSGDQPLPKEGFATRRLTNLFLDCRRDYSAILVIGPTAYHNADLQMLAARVDGIIFTVGKEARRNKAGYEALQELLELEAPILGVVG